MQRSKKKLNKLNLAIISAFLMVISGCAVTKSVALPIPICQEVPKIDGGNIVLLCNYKSGLDVCLEGDLANHVALVIPRSEFIKIIQKDAIRQACADEAIAIIKSTHQ